MNDKMSADAFSIGDMRVAKAGCESRVLAIDCAESVFGMRGECARQPVGPVSITSQDR